MADPNLPLLEDAVRKLAPFLDEIIFVGGITLGVMNTDEDAVRRSTIIQKNSTGFNLLCRIQLGWDDVA